MRKVAIFFRSNRNTLNNRSKRFYVPQKWQRLLTNERDNCLVRFSKRFRHCSLHFSILKGHLQAVCIAVVHFTEIVCCNTEITNVISVFDNRIVSMFLLRRVSQPAICLGCEDIIRFSNTIRTFVTSVLQQIISLKCTTAMHTG